MEIFEHRAIIVGDGFRIVAADQKVVGKAWVADIVHHRGQTGRHHFQRSEPKAFAGSAVAQKPVQRLPESTPHK
jgi:hypothetical protein